MQEPRQQADALSPAAKAALRTAPAKGIGLNTGLDCQFTRDSADALDELEAAGLVCQTLSLGPIQHHAFTPAGLAVRAFLLQTTRRVG
ncbi:hypothetical protein [Marinicauda sp. Alg238-R41]|uniref:hypothetical protein n=1 Tax=Marinicauda sp. Alg238-R41 TaxID=2993447 RepID=UPI0022E47DD9|nr:hypothetical protein [Marinicauda sp. Alg238-R41]